ncbi:heme-NO-binding protein [Yoonia sediminilitoris]|uniref:Heme-NO-binding protein n=2 Tax=Yoonia sediminilitoris TaxID=1286148 RepID=A0A2T6KRP6_9RHOB|nr:heme-NO-binding protein [Yoonia sediminilitoris]RCW99399.1 heme-NO-binding protein [Yoonia sediminilitoris]
MYGMVNHGIQSLIEENFGTDDWVQICEKAGIETDHFEGLLSYPDEITYTLVDIISKRYEMGTDEVLRVFGEYWIQFSSDSSIARLLKISKKNSLQENLEALNDMHDRIKLSLPHLRPPYFDYEKGEDGVDKLHYGSEREGMEPMVIGLIYGLAKETGERVEVSIDPRPAYDDIRTTFSLRYVSGIWQK